MDKRTAKREACWRAAGMVQGVMDGGYEEVMIDQGVEEADAYRIAEQLRIVIDELERRGHL